MSMSPLWLELFPLTPSHNIAVDYNGSDHHKETLILKKNKDLDICIKTLYKHMTVWYSCSMFANLIIPNLVWYIISLHYFLSCSFLKTKVLSMCYLLPILFLKYLLIPVPVNESKSYIVMPVLLLLSPLVACLPCLWSFCLCVSFRFNSTCQDNHTYVLQVV